jgi:hypothetical protein
VASNGGLSSMEFVSYATICFWRKDLFLGVNYCHYFQTRENKPFVRRAVLEFTKNKTRKEEIKKGILQEMCFVTDKIAITTRYNIHCV